ITILRASEQIKQSQIEFLARISDRIQGKVRHIWINNVINLELPINTILELLQHDDLKLIELDQKLPTSAFLDQPDRLQSLSRKTPKGKDPSSFRTSSRSHHNLDSIGAPELWRMGLTGKGILLAVLDTGIEKSHPDFAGHLWDGGSTCPEHGWDTVIDSSSTVDIDGHGTYSAGIAAGIHTGVAPDATIMAVKVLHHASESGAALNSEACIWAGFDFAIEHGAHAISMSLSIKHADSPSYTMWRTMSETLFACNVPVVVSTGKLGNKASDVTHSSCIPNNIPAPANCPPPWLHEEQKAIAVGGLSAVIACGGCNKVSELKDYSGVGPSTWHDYLYTMSGTGLLKPDLVAPSTDIITTKPITTLSPQNYTRFWGTSAATPHVAGAVALLMQACTEASLAMMPVDKILHALSVNSRALVGQLMAGKLQNGFGSGRIHIPNAYNHGKLEGWW
ncbi:MAG TPA: S8 family serine peptidase, partial [Gemmatales bacterium]|nr:S8 family serine peptidase [Gemmatales bacterium]